MLTFISRSRFNLAVEFISDLYSRAASDAIRLAYNRGASKEHQEELNGFTDKDAAEIYGIQQILAEMTRLRDNEEVFMQWVDRLAEIVKSPVISDDDLEILKQIKDAKKLYLQGDGADPA